MMIRKRFVSTLFLHNNKQKQFLFEGRLSSSSIGIISKKFATASSRRVLQRHYCRSSRRFTSSSSLLLLLFGADVTSRTFSTSSTNRNNKNRHQHHHKNDDGYVWSSLYDEARQMMGAAYVSYPLSFILREVQNGRLPNNSDKFKRKLDLIHDGDLSTALHPIDIVDLIESNRRYIEINYDPDVGDTPHDLDHPYSWLSFLKGLTRNDDDPTNISLLEFDDHNDMYRLAYGIGINKHLKRITLMFRGTYADGTSDWKRNLQVTQLQVPLPKSLQDDEDSSIDSTKTNTTNVYFHRGCYEYLFHNSDRDPLCHPKERYEEVLHNILSVIEQYPDYKIFISGHSLGGALALLVAFFASADDRIPKPVTCVSVGSLLVGDTNFNVAFDKLQSRGWIRHLRITNDDDPVPFLPPFSWYRPVGIHLCLNKHNGYTLSSSHMTTTNSSHSTTTTTTTTTTTMLDEEGSIHSSSAWNFFWDAFKNFTSIDDFLQPHNISEYLRRLEREKQHLEKITLNDCYYYNSLHGQQDDSSSNK